MLVVDDDPAIRRLLGHLLRRRFGAIVREATDGASGLELIAAERPDLLLLDVSMPVLDGWGLLARLREDPGTRELPVVTVSGTSDRETVVRMVELGVHDYILKPVNPEAAERRIGRVLAQLGLAPERD